MDLKKSLDKEIQLILGIIYLLKINLKIIMKLKEKINH